MGAGLGLLTLAILGAKSNRNGDVWTFTGVVGGMAVLLGACAVTPAYVSALDSAASHLRGTWRLAARSLTRQRTRTAAVVAAVSATTALAVAASGLLLAADAQRRHRRPYLATNQVQVITTLAGPVAADAAQPPAPAPVAAPADIIARLQGVLPGAAVLHLTMLGPPAGTTPHPLLHDFRPDHPGAVQAAGLSTTVDDGIAVVADPDALTAYRLDDRALRALRDTGAVAFGVAGRAQLTMPATAEPGVGGEGEPITVDVLDRSRYAFGGLPPLLLTAAQAQRAGLPTAPTAVVLQTPRPLTAIQRDNVQGVFDDYNDQHPLQITPTSAPQPSIGVEYFTPDNDLNPSLLNALLVTVALIFSLFVAAANLALAAAETRDERDTLSVLGAAPETIRRTSGHKALLLSLLGGLLGIPVGLLPVYVFTQIDTGDLPFAIPWGVAAAAVVVIPLAAALSTNIASAIALRRRPLQMSTMTFE
jgi:putative ABC transport system permease protein